MLLQEPAPGKPPLWGPGETSGRQQDLHLTHLLPLALFLVSQKSHSDTSNETSQEGRLTLETPSVVFPQDGSQNHNLEGCFAPTKIFLHTSVKELLCAVSPSQSFEKSISMSKALIRPAGNRPV